MNGQAPKYTVQKRANCWAVMRTGPKGGIKFVTAYDMEHQANDVAAKLNQWAYQEK
jgi:hypothetical protein